MGTWDWFRNLPPWLTAKAADYTFISWAIAVALIYAFLVWALPAILHGNKINLDNKGGIYVGRDNTGSQTVIHGPVNITHAPQEYSPLYEAQLEELREIDNFIGKKDETELRTTFDFPDMLKFNIRFAKAKLISGSVSNAQLAEMDAFFAGGRANINTKYAKLTPQEHTAFYEPIPGKFGLLNISHTHVKNFTRLTELEASSMLPTDVKTVLHTFTEAIIKNVDLMFEVINERFSANQNNLLQTDEYGSPRYGAVTTEYARKFNSLRPKAEMVSLAIRKHLGVT